jgi:hydroxymethylbilane synthase
MLAAVGQGALAIECRRDDRDTLALLAHCEDRSTRLTTACERAVLLALGADCTLPVAAHARLEDVVMTGNAWVFANGEHFHAHARQDCTCEADAIAIGKGLAAKLPAVQN